MKLFWEEKVEEKPVKRRNLELKKTCFDGIYRSAALDEENHNFFFSLSFLVLVAPQSAAN